MVNNKNLKKLVSIVIIVSFVLHMDVYVHSQGQEKDVLIERFQEAKNQYTFGQYDNSAGMIEALIGTINETTGLAEQKKDLLRQCYLLLGAIAEKKGEPVAEEHYQRAIENYGIDTIDGVNLEDLAILKKVRLTIHQVEKDFVSAISNYNTDQYKASIDGLNKILQTIRDNQLDSKDILGKTYLLLGAGNEKVGNISVAEMNYRDAFKTYRLYAIDGVYLSDLPIYTKIKRITGIEDRFENAKEEYRGGLYPISKKSIEEIIVSIPGKESDPELRKILGRCYLLLGAIYEKEGNRYFAGENYLKAKAIFGFSEIQDIDLSGLPLYKTINKGIIEHLVINKEPQSLKKKKKFPLLLVAGCVAVVVVLALFLKKKKEKEYTLTVTRGDGVDGEPAGGTYSYGRSSSVGYSYTLRSGYNNLTVLLDNSQVNASGTITMNGNHTLTAFATQNVVAFVANMDSLSIEEGDSNSFNVKLSAQPPTTIPATVSRISGDTDISVSSGSSLTFTTANWNTFQTVTLGAAEDSDTVNGYAIIRISATGIAFKDIIAIEQDNDIEDKPPVVSIISPLPNTTVSGYVAIQVNATDDKGINRVEFYIDSVMVGSDTSYPYSFNWDTTTYLGGPHVIRVIAFDTASQSSDVQITVIVTNQ